MQPSAKRQKKAEGLRGSAACHGVSDQHIRLVMRSLGSSAIAQRALTEARRKHWDRVMTTIDIDTLDGGNWTWPLCHPGLLLSCAVAESPSLQRLFRDALRARPCSREAPWSLVIGYDEFVPGNKLQLMPSRKTMNLSFSFMELGADRADRRIKQGHVHTISVIGVARCCFRPRKFSVP